MNDSLDKALSTVLEATRELTPTDREVAQVLALDRERSLGSRRARFRRWLTIAAAAVVAGGVYAVPPTRAAIDDVYGWLAPWADGEGDAPGRAAAPGEKLPNWLPAEPGATRVLAEQAGVKLVVAREPQDRLSVALGDSVGLTESIGHWQRRLAGQAVVVLGPASFPNGQGPLDAQDRRPLLGLVAESVARIEIRYASGPPTQQSGLDGGFVVLVDAARPLREIVAYGRSGPVGRVDVSHLDLRVCSDVRGCPPGLLRP